MEHLSNLTDPLTRFSLGGSDNNHNNHFNYDHNNDHNNPDYNHSEADSFALAGESPSYVAMRNMQTVLVPFFFALGLPGNLLAIGCSLSPSLRGTSSCVYMAAKCTSDTAFLAALFVMWLHRVHVDVVNVQGVCQLTVFTSYVSGFVSVWLVLAITYDNYIRICCPGLTKRRCTPRLASSVTLLIVVFAVLFYSFALWTTNVLGQGPEVPLCMALLKFKDVLMVMTFLDTVFTLVLPSLIIVPLVVCSLLAILQAYERKNRLQDSLLGHGPNSRFQNSLEAKVAKFLLTVSLTFLLLHTPAHLIRLKLLVTKFILHSGLTDTDALLQRLFETLYYFNFCCSVVIFLASGANFRAIFVSMYFRHRRNKTCGVGGSGGGGGGGGGGGSAMKLRRQDQHRPSCENQAFDPECLNTAVTMETQSSTVT